MGKFFTKFYTFNFANKDFSSNRNLYLCKFCNFTIQPMILGDDGSLTKEEVKAPVAPKKRFR